jgi:hypothetical protein
LVSLSKATPRRGWFLLDTARVDTFKHTMEVQSRIVSDIQADEAGLKQRFGESRVDLMAYGRTPWS